MRSRLMPHGLPSGEVLRARLSVALPGLVAGRHGETSIVTTYPAIVKFPLRCESLIVSFEADARPNAVDPRRHFDDCASFVDRGPSARTEWLCGGVRRSPREECPWTSGKRAHAICPVLKAGVYEGFVVQVNSIRCEIRDETGPEPKGELSSVTCQRIF